MTFPQRETRRRDDDLDDLIQGRKPSFRNCICSITIRGLLAVSLIAICVPLLVYYLVIDKGTYRDNETSTCLVEKTYRVPCGYPNISSKECTRIHCCYSNSAKQCFHYVPSKYFYYAGKNSASYKQTPLYRTAIPKMFMFVSETDENRVSVVLQNSSRAPSEPLTLDKNKAYVVDKSTDQLAVEIYRSTGHEKDNIIFSTAKGPLIASDGYWEWTFQLSNDKLFVFGEMFVALENENSTFTKIVYKNKNEHTFVPMFIGYRKGKFTGLVIKHERPLEITIMPSNLVILRSLGESKIELELTVGPKPENVFQQQQQDYNLRLLPDWVVGVHVCREDVIVDAEDAIYEYKQFQLNATKLPYTSDCFHQNLVMMMQKGKNISEIQGQIKSLKSSKKFLLSLPPHLYRNENNTMYNLAKKAGILYMDPVFNNGTEYMGSYLQEPVVYPDYSCPAAGQFMGGLVTELYNKLNVTPDGFILNDNWPSDDKFVMDGTSNEFPYLSKELVEAMSSTIPWNATADGTKAHFLHHNQYGSQQRSLIENHYTFQNESMLIMSASGTYNTYPAMVQNVNISWTNLKKFIKLAVSSSMFGNNYVSLPVCGSTEFFSSKSMEELCLRWYITAATMPLFRISSVFPKRFPQNMYTNFTLNHMLDILNKRNQLSAHFYGLLRKKEPFLRPMFYDFYDDNNTLLLDEQYMIGKDILVAQPMLLGKTKLLVYMPPAVGVWYTLWNGLKYDVSTGNGWVSVDVVPTDWVSFVAQGSIIPLTQVFENSTLLDVIIPLNCTKEPCNATGILYMPESTLTFYANRTAATIQGFSPQTHNDMNCNQNMKYLLNKLYVYMDIQSTPKHPNIDLCKVKGTSISVNYDSKPTVIDSAR